MVVKDKIKIPINEESAPEGIEDQDARQRLLTSAARLFAEKGLDGVTTRDIAQASGCNISLISYYFQGKEGLYRSVMLEFGNQATEIVRKITHGEIEKGPLTAESFSKAMKSLIFEMMSFKMKSQDITLILSREMSAGLPYARELYEGLFFKIVQDISQVVKAAQQAGIVKKEINPHVLFLALAHTSDAFFLVQHCGTSLKDHLWGLPEGLNQYCDQLYKLFFEGVLV